MRIIEVYKLTLIVLTINLSLNVQAQPTDFGEVTSKDFAVPSQFAEASSVVLLDKAKFIYDYRGYDVYPVLERHLRVKINKRSGFDTWGDYVLGNSSVKFSKIKAASYVLENGAVVVTELDKDKIIVDRAHSKEKVVSLPNLKEGCIIELSFTATYYRIISPDWPIQREVPVLWSEYVLGGTRSATCVIMGGIKPDIWDQTYKSVYSRWVFKNVPAFVPENHMGSEDNFYAKLKFYVPEENWTGVSKYFQRQHFLAHEKFQTRVVKKTAEDITVNLKDDFEKVKAIVDYVKSNFIWDGTKDYLAYDLADVYDKKKGSSGDLNIFLHSMLQEAGFKPTLVLLSTRSNGFINKQIPTHHQFNYIVSKLRIGDKDLFLDATDPLLPYDVVPQDCFNTEGFEMVDKTFNWIHILPPLRDKTNVNARLTIGNELTLKGRVTVQTQGYEGRQKRSSLKESGRDKFLSGTNENGWLIDSVKITNEHKFDLPFQEMYFTAIPNHINETPERLYLNPFVMLQEKENVWKDEKRLYPIDFLTPTEKMLVVNLTIPDNYRVEQLPESATYVMADNSISCSFKTVQSNNIVVVTYQFLIRKTWFTQEEYPAIKDFYNQIIAKQSQPIVLLKSKM